MMDYITLHFSLLFWIAGCDYYHKIGFERSGFKNSATAIRSEIRTHRALLSLMVL